jgi:tRNA 2-thiouridine synthesizing protein E
MSAITFGTRTYQLDAHGYLESREQWDTVFAEGMAAHLGISEGLTDRHWKVISYIRRYTDEKDDIPFLHQACREFGLSLDAMRALFPSGYHRGAFCIAGLSHGFMVKVNVWLTYETTAAARDRTPVCPLGFLRDPGDWSREFAARTAVEHGIEGGLGEKHWQVIESIRARFQKTGTVPLVCEICERNDLTLNEINELFPRGYHRGACKIAGLNPRT